MTTGCTSHLLLLNVVVKMNWETLKRQKGNKIYMVEFMSLHS